MSTSIHDGVTRLLQYAELFASNYRNSLGGSLPQPLKVELESAIEITSIHINHARRLVLQSSRSAPLKENSVLQRVFADTHRSFQYLVPLIQGLFNVDFSDNAFADTSQFRADYCAAHSFSHELASIVITELSTTAADPHEAFALRFRIARDLIMRAAELAGLAWSESGKIDIRRSLRFPPESKQAAVGILSYFSAVVQRKYPDIDVSVALVQENDRVTMIVTTPNGEEDRIEQELDEYGRVVTGELTPERYMPDQLSAMALRQKLELASLEIRHMRDLLNAERANYGGRIQTLEDHVAFLKGLLGRNEHNTAALIDILQQLSKDVTPIAKTALEEAIGILKLEYPAPGDARVVEPLRKAAAADRSFVDRLNEYVIKGAVQGAAGQYLFLWLQAIAASFK